MFWVPGVDQVQSLNCWATCGYNIMKEFGSQRIAAPPTLRSDLVVVRNKDAQLQITSLPFILWHLNAI